jgi:hypothetical protein
VDGVIELLESSYEEVLDATKHQEDKVSRLLTAIAFITASSLALANFGTFSRAVEHTYDLGDVKVPLAALTLGTFLVGVVATVVILLSSITTPLRLPGAPKGGDNTEHVNYADPAVEASQIYFYEISGFSVDEWQRKWRSDEAALRRERRDSLVVETHNLATRTTFKYERMNEAVSVLSFALFAFALSIVLVLLAVTQDGAASVRVEEVEIGDFARVTLASIIFGYAWLQLFVSARERVLTVEEIDGVSTAQANFGPWVFSVVRLLFPIAAAFVPAALAAIPLREVTDALLFVVLPAALAWLMFAYITVRGAESRSRAPQLERVPPADPLRTTPRKLRVLVWTCLIWLGYSGAAFWAVGAESYSVQFAAACSSALVLLVASLVARVGSRRRRLSDYRQRQRQAAAAVQQ